MIEQSIDSGHGKIGWMCSYVPEEIILAAGLEPSRIQGRVEAIERADAYTFSNLCPYLKNLLDSGLRHKLDGMAGIVFANSCDGMRRLSDLWRHYVGTPFSYMLEVPKNRNDDAIGYFADKLLDLKSSIEDAFGAAISEEKLKEAIRIMNEHRTLVGRIFEAQQEDPPRYKGSELLSILNAEAMQPKLEMTALLRDMAMRGASTVPGGRGGPRLLVAGSRLDRPALFEMVENAGGAIVAIDTCNGLRHYTGLVEDSADPLHALARRYLLMPSCPRMPGFETRMERMVLLAKEYGAQGIIYGTLKFCDYGLFEQPQLDKLSQEVGLPVLALENDYVWSDTERLRTRIEAFLEMIRSEL
jgi:benzoyl-CoA reductase subunit C